MAFYISSYEYVVKWYGAGKKFKWLMHLHALSVLCKLCIKIKEPYSISLSFYE